MDTKDYIKHFKKEVPLLGVLLGLGCTAALAKQANNAIKPKIDRILIEK